MGITVVVIDDHEVFRAGLVSWFNKTVIRVVAETTNSPEGVKLVVKHKPEVVLLDIQMPEMGGFDMLDKIQTKSPDRRIIMLAAHDNPTYIARAAALGAADFMLKGASRQELISTIVAAAERKGLRREGVIQEIAAIMSKTEAAGENGIQLTEREAQVLRHLAFGLSNKEIGRSLKIGDEAVKAYMQHIFREINVTDRIQAAVWALRKGMV